MCVSFLFYAYFVTHARICAHEYDTPGNHYNSLLTSLGAIWTIQQLSYLIWTIQQLSYLIWTIQQLSYLIWTIQQLSRLLYLKIIWLHDVHDLAERHLILDATGNRSPLDLRRISELNH